MRAVALSACFVGFGVAGMALGARMGGSSSKGAGSAKLAEAPSTAQPLAGSWELQPQCLIRESMGQRAIVIHALLEGTETVTTCPVGVAASTCAVGQMAQRRYHLDILCDSHDYGETGDWTAWACSTARTNVVDLDAHRLGHWTVQPIEANVRTFDAERGEARVGPIYGGVDLVVTGARATAGGEAAGGSVDVVGIGGREIKSKIDLHGACGPAGGVSR